MQTRWPKHKRFQGLSIYPLPYRIYYFNPENVLFPRNWKIIFDKNLGQKIMFSFWKDIKFMFTLFKKKCLLNWDKSLKRLTIRYLIFNIIVTFWTECIQIQQYLKQNSEIWTKNTQIYIDVKLNSSKHYELYAKDLGLLRKIFYLLSCSSNVSNSLVGL